MKERYKLPEEIHLFERDDGEKNLEEPVIAAEFQNQKYQLLQHLHPVNREVDAPLPTIETATSYVSTRYWQAEKRQAVITPLLDDPKLQQIKYESQTQSREVLRLLSDHPHIINPFLYGFSAEELQRGEVETLYWVNEYIGPTLYDWMHLDSANLTDLRQYLKQAMGAIQYAHDNGYLHGDGSPYNVLISPTYGAQVIDFENALDINSPDPEKELMTSNLFSAPELFARNNGEDVPIGPASDVYAFGRSLFFMLLDMDRNGDRRQIKQEMEALLGKDRAYIDFSCVLKKMTGKDIIYKKHYESLKQVIIKATQKKQHLRYQSMAEMWHDLDQAFDEVANAKPTPVEVVVSSIWKSFTNS